MKKDKALNYSAKVIPVISVVLLFACSGDPNVTTEELQQHVIYLSSDSLKGRMTGTDGDSLAAEYIKNELASAGLKPLSGDGLQRFKITRGMSPGDANSLVAGTSSFKCEEDFMPMSFSSNGKLEAEIIFAGYGFNIDSDSLKWNDYKGIDVKGKWVMILRADPETDNTTSLFIPYSSDRDKALMAKDMGASGILFVSGAAFDSRDSFETLNSGDFSVDIPAFRIKRAVADNILLKTGKSIAALENSLNKTRKPNSFVTNVTISGEAEIIREKVSTRNVAMILPGEDEKLKDEYIIIGAHFDHLGMGGPGSSSRAIDTIAPHHGADDNSSGVAMMIELAERFAATKGSHKRSIVCVAFSGEELGLLGSKYFAENPGIDLAKVNVMINLDMVGRLQETNKLQIGGAGTAEGFKELIYSANDTSIIKLALSEEGYGPSDHSSFYGKDIPVLFYSSGAHLDYHTPFDTYDKLNYQGMVDISSMVFNTASMLATSDTRLIFKEAGPKTDTGRAMRRKGVTLGIMPDFAGNIKNGLRADFVTPGKPAAIGGMKKGDIITVINGKKVNNIQDYMFRMGQLKHGETINVEVLRDDKTEILLIQL
jgi:hypothetical protein